MINKTVWNSFTQGSVYGMGGQGVRSDFTQGGVYVARGQDVRSDFTQGSVYVAGGQDVRSDFEHALAWPEGLNPKDGVNKKRSLPAVNSRLAIT